MFSLYPETTYWFTVFAQQPDGSGGWQYSGPVSVQRFGSMLRGVHIEYFIGYGSATWIRCALTDRSSHQPLADKRVTLWTSVYGKRWTKVGGTTTDSRGRASLHVAPRRSRQYRWAFNGDHQQLPTINHEDGEVDVHYLVTAKLTRTASAPGQTVHMFGAIRPDHHDNQKVWLLHYRTHCACYWRTSRYVIAATQRLPDGSDTYGFIMPVTRRAAGTYRFEAAVDGDAHLSGAPSRPLVLRVG